MYGSYCKTKGAIFTWKDCRSIRAFQKNHDEQTAERAQQLAKKLDEKEFSIAFCGHFSAGKSTMINKLVGDNLLPSSPIPTSANLVKVKAGEEYAKVFFKQGKPRLYLAPYDYEKVKRIVKMAMRLKQLKSAIKMQVFRIMLSSWTHLGLIPLMMPIELQPSPHFI